MDFFRRAQGVHGKLADAIGNPSRVWCRTCGASEPVDAADALAHGWPKHCGYTMTIDHPSTWDDSSAKERALVAQP